MKANRMFLLTMLLVPLAVTVFACGHRPDDETAQIVNTHVVRASDKNRGYLGVSVDRVTPKLARKWDLKVSEGVYVAAVTSDSPAEEAGIKEGDVILAYDGNNVYDNSDLISDVRRTKPGTDVQITINRNGEQRSIKATIGKIPREPRMYSFNIPTPPRMRIAPHISWNNTSTIYGLTLEKLSRQLGEYFGAPDGRGLLMKNVKRGSKGESAGFKAGDVILKIGNDLVDDVHEALGILREFDEGEKAELEVLRKGKKEKLTITIDEDNERELSYRWQENDGDAIMDLIPLEEGIHFRHEADRMKREGEKLKRNLERMKDHLHDGMIDLREKIRREVDRIRTSVDV